MSNNKNSKALSILGSVLGVSVVLAVLIYKDEDLRAEAQKQLSSLLRTTRKMLRRSEMISHKSGSSTYTRRIDEKNTFNDDPKEWHFDEAYDNAWSLIENKLQR